ncbi:MAG: lytic transglycosylase domain-containing protein [Hyphomicrobiales bacterium]|nr:lytic transglycosylase domain-containing protein [Hyphomicrobiales bacterium]
MLKSAIIAGALLLVISAGAESAPKQVIEAIIKVESGGRAHVTGSAGEIGLMQIRCQSARGIGFKGNCRDLYDARTNVRWGTAYFAEALRSAGGHLDTAISRYQRGIYSKYRGCSAYCRKVKAAMR